MCNIVLHPVVQMWQKVHHPWFREERKTGFSSFILQGGENWCFCRKPPPLTDTFTFYFGFFGVGSVSYTGIQISGLGQDNASVPSHQNCGKLCTPNTLNDARQKAPFVAGSWFSCLIPHSRHSSESNAVWPDCGVAPKVHECDGNFCGVTFPHERVTLQGMCHCTGLGTSGEPVPRPAGVVGW